jgi:simple sugar transport system permease protein
MTASLLARLLPIARALAFVLLALVLCGLVFELAGYPAPLMFRSIAEGAVLNPHAWEHSLRWALPLFITASGVVLSFRCGYFNVGAQGQFYMGAIAATFVADGMHGGPAVLALPLAFAAGIGAGALWALWPGLLRVRSGTDEVITTLMGNFIAGLVLVWVSSGPLKDPSGTGQVMASRPVDAAFRLSTSAGLSPAIVGFALLVGIGMWVLVNRTAFGVLSSLAGRNPIMVVWQGARLSRLGLAGFVIGGGLAGLAGTIEVLGPNGRLVSGFLPTHGFTAILIALVAGLSIAGTAVASLFFGGLAAAGLYLPVLVGLPAAAIDIINAAIALFITARIGPGMAWRLRLARRRSPAADDRAAAGKRAA